MQIQPHGKFGVGFSFERIYDGKQRVMKPREIFTLNVRAYYPQEENGVNKNICWKLCVVSVLTAFCLYHESFLQTVRSVLAHEKSMRQDSDVLFSGVVYCLITLLWSITFTMQLMWHLYLKCTQDHHLNAKITDTHRRETVWRTCHCLVINLKTGHLL